MESTLQILYILFNTKYFNIYKHILEIHIRHRSEVLIDQVLYC